jgi:hypothetical protein
MPVPYTQLLAALRKGGPMLAKQLPKLWPLLLESSNRKKVVEAASDLASQSPTKRLRARVELTAELADAMVKDSESGEDVERAADWARRARNLLRRLDMPVEGRKAKSAHRMSIREQMPCRLR